MRIRALDNEIRYQRRWRKKIHIFPKWQTRLVIYQKFTPFYESEINNIKHEAQSQLQHIKVSWIIRSVRNMFNVFVFLLLAGQQGKSEEKQRIAISCCKCHWNSWSLCWSRRKWWLVNLTLITTKDNCPCWVGNIVSRVRCCKRVYDWSDPHSCLQGSSGQNYNEANRLFAHSRASTSRRSSSR